jgi:hypothetical protein
MPTTMKAYFTVRTQNTFNKMVLSKPEDAPVPKLFDLTGKVAAITGAQTFSHFNVTHH